MRDLALTLTQVGWTPAFARQLAQHPAGLLPARVIAVQRTGLTLAPEIHGLKKVAVAGRFFVQGVEARPTIGDWVLVDPVTGALEAVLVRSSLIKRLSPAGEVQLIAANINTAFIVTSCNADFSLSRLERYLSVVIDAGITPVVVVTKIDAVEEAAAYVTQARSLGPDIPVEAVNALDETTLKGLLRWCGPRQSIALLGSSGVGKSTLVNTLSGQEVQTTRAVRSEDDKGRHTTTSRSLHVLPYGGVILDSPGMREFQLAEAEQGVESLFMDVERIASACKFNDCKHGPEPGCAVRNALADGSLDARRLASFVKLQQEEQSNRAAIAQRGRRHQVASKKKPL